MGREGGGRGRTLPPPPVHRVARGHWQGSQGQIHEREAVSEEIRQIPGDTLWRMTSQELTALQEVCAKFQEEIDALKMDEDKLSRKIDDLEKYARRAPEAEGGSLRSWTRQVSAAWTRSTCSTGTRWCTRRTPPLRRALEAEGLVVWCVSTESAPTIERLVQICLSLHGYLQSGPLLRRA